MRFMAQPSEKLGEMGKLRFQTCLLFAFHDLNSLCGGQGQTVQGSPGPILKAIQSPTNRHGTAALGSSLQIGLRTARPIEPNLISFTTVTFISHATV